MKQPYIECGKILTTHGVRGAVKVEPWCDAPSVLTGLTAVYFKTPTGYEEHKLLGGFVRGSGATLTLEGISTPEEAQKLRGRVLYARREEIPVAEGEMLLCDMIGLPVIDRRSELVYGTLARIEDSPAAPLYVVRTATGEVYLPAVPAFVKELSPSGIYIEPIEGFFDEV